MGTRGKSLFVAILLLGAYATAACGATPTLETEAPTAGEAANGSESCTGDCLGPERHAIGESIAETFETPYEQVMTWFCEGHEFEDILLALQTQEDSGVPAEELLAMRPEKAWEQIWEELGLLD